MPDLISNSPTVCYTIHNVRFENLLPDQLIRGIRYSHYSLLDIVWIL